MSRNFQDSPGKDRKSKEMMEVVGKTYGTMLLRSWYWYYPTVSARERVSMIHGSSLYCGCITSAHGIQPRTSIWVSLLCYQAFKNQSPEFLHIDDHQVKDW